MPIPWSRRGQPWSKEILSISAVDNEHAVFANESGPGGKRHYLVASRSKFWSVYKTFQVKKYYEVIKMGTPCKLFFDLEFDISVIYSILANIFFMLIFL